MQSVALGTENRSQSWANSDAESVLNKLSFQIGRKIGNEIAPFSTQAVERFCDIESSRQQQILGTVSRLSDLLSNTETEPATENGEHPEKAEILMALKFFGMELRDDIWKHISPDEIIEIYDDSDIQIFRSLNFFKISSYSLLDLLTHEWFHLWERPKSVLDQMMNLMGRLHSSIDTVEQAGIPTHILKEILEDKENGISSRKSVQIDFNVACPLYKIGGGRSGYIVTCKAKVLDQGESVDKVHFI